MRHRPTRRCEQLVHREVGRSRAAQSRRVPGVEDLDIGRRKEHETEVAVVDDRAAADPLAVLRAAPPLPPTRDDETALGRAPDAARRERATGHRERIAAVDLVGVRFGEVRRHRSGRRRDHRAPRRRGIVARELVDHLHEGHGIELRTAVPLRQAELEEASLGEHPHDLARQAPQRLGFVGVRSGGQARARGRRRAGSRGSRIVGQAQHPLGDDVALHLARCRRRS